MNNMGPYLRLVPNAFWLKIKDVSFHCVSLMLVALI